MSLREVLQPINRKVRTQELADQSSSRSVVVLFSFFFLSRAKTKKKNARKQNGVEKNPVIFQMLSVSVSVQMCAVLIVSI